MDFDRSCQRILSEIIRHQNVCDQRYCSLKSMQQRIIWNHPAIWRNLLLELIEKSLYLCQFLLKPHDHESIPVVPSRYHAVRVNVQGLGREPLIRHRCGKWNCFSIFGSAATSVRGQKSIVQPGSGMKRPSFVRSRNSRLYETM